MTQRDERPTGTVTLLFSDIEGSTRLLLRLGDRYPALLEEHRRILGEAIAGARGQVVDLQGDGLFAVFARAADALIAAAAGQQALAAHPWPDGVVVRARMGVHTGEPTRTADGYAGLDVHRAARICAAGHGGQVLVSRNTRDLADEALPPGLRLRDLGEFRLKDLPHSERLIQLVVHGLQEEFPPVRGLDVPTNLPAQRREIIGRDRDVAICREILLRPETSLLTLVGPGGCGKTRLALHLAAGLLDAFPDGVYFVPLAGVGEATQVPAAIVSALGVREVGDRSPLETAADGLRSRRCLLVLDNLEHLLAATPQIAGLLDACPNLKVLATSREVIHLSGEHDYVVPTLALPDASRTVDVDRLLDAPATRLFVERARDVKPDLALGDGEASVVAEICRRLDGLPLAIELAASRVRLLPPTAMLARLAGTAGAVGHDRGATPDPRGAPLTLLTGGPRDLPARQRTLRDTIAWSHDLLSDAERQLFRRLAIFVGGWTLEAAEAVCGFAAGDRGWGIGDREAEGEALSPIPHPLSPAVLDGLASLIDKSLMFRHDAAAEEPRFAMLETIREFALEQLEASGEEPDLHQQHAEYFLALAETAAPHLIAREQVGWLDTLESEHDNLAAALTWLSRSADDWAIEANLRLAGALHWFWWLGGRIGEGRARLREALARVGAEDDAAPAARARALYATGGLAMVQGDYDEAHAAFTESAELYRAVGDVRGAGRSLVYVGVQRMLLGDRPAERALLEQALAILGPVDDAWGLALAGSNLASSLRFSGDAVRADRLLAEYLPLARRAGDRYLLGSVMSKGGNLALELGDYGRAETHCREALGLFRDLRDGWWTARCLEFLAYVALERGGCMRAARLLGAAAARLESVGARHIPTEHDRHDRAVSRLQAALGDQAYEAAWADGHAMAQREAVDFALAEPASDATRGGADPGRGVPER